MATDHSWPAGMPLPVLSGYGHEPQSAFVRTEMDAGPPRLRRRQLSPMTRISCAWLLDGGQMETFRAFFHATLDEGGAWFSLSLAFADPQPQRVEVRFVGPYSASLRSPGLWSVSGELEARTRPALYSISALERSRFHMLVHWTLPKNVSPQGA